MWPALLLPSATDVTHGGESSDRALRVFTLTCSGEQRPPRGKIWARSDGGIVELAVSAHQFQPEFIPPGKPASSSDDVRVREQQAGGDLVVEAKDRTHCSSSCRAQKLDRSRLLPANAGWGWDHWDSRS